MDDLVGRKTKHFTTLIDIEDWQTEGQSTLQHFSGYFGRQKESISQHLYGGSDTQKDKKMS